MLRPVKNAQRIWTVYLSGEIHTNWRSQLQRIAYGAGLRIDFTSPVVDHQASDECGVKILGPEPSDFWKDHKGAKLNAIRTRTLIEDADIVVVRFGDMYKQWNAAFDAGQAAALGKSLIVIHDPALSHALKEVDAVALAVCSNSEQLIQVLSYVTGADTVSEPNPTPTAGKS
jgi:YtoQ family protein